MTDLLPFLKSLLTLPGLSGYESSVRDVIAATWRPLVDELSFSRLGSIHALRHGSGVEPRPRLLLSAHMDAIGLMVTGNIDGFLRITEIGGIDNRILPGQLVTVHGRQDLPAVVVQPPARLLPPGSAERPVKMENLWVDTGLLPEQIRELVRVGDLVSFAGNPVDLTGETVSGHSLDNRASVAALTVCLEELKSRVHAWDVWGLASVQEEETLAGALTSTFQIRPDLAVVIDVTFAKGPGSNDYSAFPLGKVITLEWGPNVHPALFRLLKETAERVEVPYATEMMPHHSETDAFGIQVVAEGVPTMVVGIPLRYMHTPVEVVSLKDIRRAGRLLAEVCARLDADFMKKINWE